jgi:arginase
MAKGIPGFSPVAEEKVVLAGVRDMEPAERERLDASELAVVGADRIEKEGLRHTLALALDALRARVSKVYVHLDLDVLDAKKVGRANEFASEGGLSTEELDTALRMVRERFTVAACGIASYDPALDAGGQVLLAALAGARALTSPVGESAV